MKVSKMTTRVVQVPLERPVRTAIHDIHSIGCVLVQLETDQGLVGEGFLFALNAAHLRAFDEMARGFASFVEGRDPHFVGAVRRDLLRAINPLGRKGVAISALSAIDTALWDLVGKASERPLHRLFGACRARVPTYASGGLWLSQSPDELAEEAARFVSEGFRSMKIRVGLPDPRRDVERVRIVRAAVGDEVEILADANQGLSPKQAVRLGRLLEEHRVAWLEEPVDSENLKGQARVRAALDLAIASGENEYMQSGMRAVIEAGAADVLTPDLQRIGGLTEMRKVAHLAEAFHLPVSTHIFTEYSLALAGSAANCISVEHMPWCAPLFREALVLEEGALVIPERPGTGFSFDPEAIRRFALQ